MSMDVDPAKVRATFEKLRRDAEAGGYHLNPDEEFTLPLIEGLLVNQARYGYMACPCRLASGDRDDDLDIVCPCDYRDPDLSEYGACYCGLYVSDEVLSGQRQLTAIPERRPSIRPKKPAATASSGLRVWRCKVCGYLCAREQPPGVCPICKVKADRFEEFNWPVAVATG